MPYKKIAVITIAILAVLGAGFGIYSYSQSKNQSDTSTTEDGIDYGPPSEKEKKLSEQQNEQRDNQDQSNATQPEDSRKQVTPIITSLSEHGGSVEASARVPKVNENGGKCTLALAKGDKTVSANRTGRSNVNEVSCGFISIPRSKLNSGVWSATVSYSSEKAKGTSKPQNIEVQ